MLKSVVSNWALIFICTQGLPLQLGAATWWDCWARNRSIALALQTSPGGGSICQSGSALLMVWTIWRVAVCQLLFQRMRGRDTPWDCHWKKLESLGPQDWRDVSVVKNTYCSCQGLEYDSQHPLPVTPVPGNLMSYLTSHAPSYTNFLIKREKNFGSSIDRKRLF